MSEAPAEKNLNRRENFSEPWEGSNVIIHAQNARDGNVLHACKTVLAMESTYFHLMFYSGYNTEEKAEKKTEVNVPVDYDVLHCILLILHNSKTDYSTEGCRFLIKSSENMYKAAGVLKLPRIQKLCVEHLRVIALADPLVEWKSVEAAGVAVRLGLYDIFVEYSRRMSLEDVKDLAIRGNALESSPSLSKADVPWFHDALFPDAPFRHHRPERRVLQLEEIATMPKKITLDLNKKWRGCDLGIVCVNAKGRILYCFKENIARSSPKFFDVLSKNSYKRGERRNKVEIINVKVEYATMRQMMWMVHCAINAEEDEPIIHPVLLYDMYRSCGPDEMNMPVLRVIFRDLLRSSEQFTTVDALDVAVKMGIHSDELMRFAGRLTSTPQEIDDWINGRRLVYQRLGKEVDLTSSNTVKLMSLSGFFSTYPLNHIN